MAYMLRFIILFALADFVIPAIFNGTFDPLTQVAKGELKDVITRRKGKKDRSTSSSSGEKKGADSSPSGHSLELSISDSTESDKKKTKKKNKKSYRPKSSRERTGWKKWHRKCQQCPEDMRMKWRDPNIKWICGAYQRARRSFKSLCMMHYRNCQDGTMFTKIADHRCENASDILRHGDHFFYDYKVDLSIDTSNSEDSGSSSKESSKSSDASSKSLNSDRIKSLEKSINDLGLRHNKV